MAKVRDCGADIGHVIENTCQKTENPRIGKTDQPRAEPDDDRNSGIDHRHDGEIAGEIALDVAHDFQEFQLGVTIAE